MYYLPAEIAVEVGTAIRTAQTSTTVVVPCEPRSVTSAKGKAWLAHGRHPGSVQLAATFELTDKVDLRHAKLRIENVLEEIFGAGELVAGFGGPDAPVELRRVGHSSKSFARFRSTGPHAAPYVAATLERRKGTQLALSLVVWGADVDGAEACTGRPSMTELVSNALLEDAGDLPLRLHVHGAWQCQKRRLKLREFAD